MVEEIDQKQNNRKLFNKTVLVGFTIMIIAASFWIGFFQGKKQIVLEINDPIALGKAIVINKENSNDILDFSLFWKSWELLKEKYVDSENLDSRKLLYGAINGLMQATGDPYTVYLDPEENKNFNDEITGSFEGIGAEMGIKGKMLTIIAPLDGSPAEKAGLKSGDKILKINGDNSADMTLDGAVDKIRGPKGTEVKLVIWRNGEEEGREITIKRDIITVKSVKAEFREDGIAYIKISRFGEDTAGDFNSLINQAVSQKTKGLIIDLRNNPGGYLDSSVKIASKMIPMGKIVVIEENADKSQNKIPTTGGDIASAMPTMVLINEGSASASEILAGALKDNRENVTLIGKKSFGKGSVQELIKLPQGTAAKITVARWLTPNGAQINEVGISPNVEVNITDEDYNNDKDPQLDKAVEILTEKLKN